MSDESTNNSTTENKGHPFDRMMFGNRRAPNNQSTPQIKEQQEEQKTIDQPEVPSNTQAQNFDLTAMMQNVDQIMSSINKIKPMAKQLSPLLDLFKSKK